MFLSINKLLLLARTLAKKRPMRKRLNAKLRMVFDLLTALHSVPGSGNLRRGSSVVPPPPEGLLVDEDNTSPGTCGLY